jgi:predicted ATPase/DNA-binding SARP family transcriptional activator
VEIGVLGTLRVRDEAGRTVAVGGRRARRLLILLALDAGRVVPVSSLIARLWDDDPPAGAGNALQSVISRLRGALAGLGSGVIESHAGGYRLAVPPETVDALAFESLARHGSRGLAAGDAAGAARLLREALGAWRGPALADVADADFAAGPIARLEELRLAATLDRIEAELLLGERASLAGELRSLIAADPLAERPRGLLMRTLSADGRQAEALAVYQETREALRDNLGIDPSPQLEQIYLDLLRQKPLDPERGRGDSAPNVRVTHVRTALTSFVGRQEELRQVLKLLDSDRLITLTGPGGVGKTRLSAEALAKVAAERCFVELAPVTDATEVPYAVLDALGIRESGLWAGPGRREATTDPVDRLVAGLGDRQVVLVLDNCEHLIAPAAALAGRVLAACPGVRVLATSREALGITGERLWPVPALDVPPQDWTPDVLPDAVSSPVAEILDYPAVKLLSDRAVAVSPGFGVDAANAVAVARICRALDGMPLAIELAAARLRALSPAQLAERLDDRFALLTGGSRTAMPRHQTLRAVVDWSWETLSEPEQVLARRLAVFPGGATLSGAERVCRDAGAASEQALLPAPEVLTALSGLVDKSLLAVENPRRNLSAQSEPRYRMLETVRAYGLERLAEAGEEHWVRGAFCAHFLDLAETAEPLLRTREQVRWIREFAAEQDNINAAVRWAIEQHEVRTALRFGRALGWFWIMRGQRQESAALAREILTISYDPAVGAGAGPDQVPTEETVPTQDSLLVAEARVICVITGMGPDWDLDSVREPLASALELSESGVAPGGAPTHPLFLIAGSMLAMYDRDYERALRLLEVHFESADPWNRAASRLQRAFYSLSIGRRDAVVRDCDVALAGFREIGDNWGIAMTLWMRAEIASPDGDFAVAIAALEEAVRVSKDLTEWEDAAHIYGKLAILRARAGNHQGAAADLARAERTDFVSREAGWWLEYMGVHLAWLRDDLANARIICVRLDQELAGRSSVLYQDFRALIRARLGLLELRGGTGSAACGAPDIAASRRLLTEALGFAAEGVDRTAVAAVVDGLAVLALAEDALSHVTCYMRPIDSADADSVGGIDGAEWAATLLGAAHSIRGVFDHSSLDAPAARDGARRALGDPAFDAAYQRGRALSYEDVLALAARKP